MNYFPIIQKENKYGASALISSIFRVLCMNLNELFVAGTDNNIQSNIDQLYLEYC